MVFLLHILEHLPIEYDEKELLKKLRIERMKSKEKEIVSMIRESKDLVEPKAIYTYLKVVEIDNANFRLENEEKMESIILGDLLSLGQEVAPYVVTIGNRLEEQVSKLEPNDIFLALILNNIGDYALEIAKKNLKSLIKEKLGDYISSFDPGSGTGELFTLEQLSTLFQILQPSQKIGVHLTPNRTMRPLKTIAGIFAATEDEYIACQHCPKKCEYREKSYVGEYHRRHVWKK